MSDDPRPDYEDDAPLWRHLLAITAAKDADDPDGCHGRFLILRCYGVRLVRGDGTLRLVPRDDDENRNEWPDLRRRVLEPRRDDMAAILRQAAA